MRDLTPPGMTLAIPTVRIARTNRWTGRLVIALASDTADETAGVLLIDKNGGGPTDPDQLLSSGALSTTSGSSGKGVTTVLVPDGVRAVALTTHGATTRAMVRNTVAVLAASYPGLTTATTWYGTNGEAIKRIPAPAQ